LIKIKHHDKMDFKDLDFKKAEQGGVQAKVFFSNGFGASIVKSSYSYGGTAGLYELAVLKGNSEKWDLTYETEITEDVLGHQTEQEISEVLKAIEALS